MKSKKFLGGLLALVMALSLGVFAACGNGVPATDITLDSTSLELIIGDSDTLTASVEPSDSTDEVTWSVNADGASVVSLSATSGSSVTVTAEAAGSATITATAGEQTATCTVTVKIADVTVNTAANLISAVANTANAGKTIYIENGTYNLPSQVRIAQNITLIGESETDVVLQPAEGWENTTTSKGLSSVITVTNGADVNISNLTVKGGYNLAMSAGTDYAHGINVAQAGTVVISNVTASDNDGVGVLVNDSVVTLNNVSTSGNGWGGVNVDVVGRAWNVPATVLTVDENCSFAEQLAIYCDEEAENNALDGKVKVPASYNQDAIVFSIAGGSEVRYVWTADETISAASKVIVATSATITADIAQMQDGAVLYLTAGTYQPENGEMNIKHKGVSIIGAGSGLTIVEGYIKLGIDNSAMPYSDSVYTVKSLTLEATAENTGNIAISFNGNETASQIELNVENCIIDGFLFGMQIGGSPITESQLNITSTTFIDAWCAISVGGKNVYTVSECTFDAGCSYQLQVYVAGEEASNDYYVEIGSQSSGNKNQEMPSVSEWWSTNNQ